MLKILCLLIIIEISLPNMRGIDARKESGAKLKLFAKLIWKRRFIRLKGM